MKRFKSFLTESVDYDSDESILTRILQEIKFTYDSSHHTLTPAFVWCEYDAEINPPVKLYGAASDFSVNIVRATKWSVHDNSFNRRRYVAMNTFETAVGSTVLTWQRFNMWSEAQGTQFYNNFHELTKQVFGKRLDTADGTSLAVWLNEGTTKNPFPPYKLYSDPAATYPDPFEAESHE